VADVRGIEAAVSDDGVSADELDAVLISRFLRDGERLFLGANLNAARAGAAMAAATHAPGLIFAQALSWIDLPKGVSLPPARPGVDLRDAVYAEALIRDDEVFDDVRRFATVFILGGLQIDPYGNTNMVGWRSEDDDGWRPRGPGPIGTTTMSTIAPRKLLYTRRHDPNVLVERCELITALGWRRPNGPTRAELGIETPGPELCVTPAGVFDFPEPERRMRLCALRPGWDVDAVGAATGFEFEVAPDVGPVEPPTAAELAILRDNRDRGGRP
jgi:glutaconate CoA-transferase subunit B